MKVVLVFSVSFLLVTSLFALLVSAQVTNVAIGQNASQFSTLDFNGFNWTADRIVDNCTSQDDPNIHQCCGASQDISGTNLNFMRVDFDKVYSINNIVIYGRGDMEGQTKDFQVSIVDGDGSEILVYDNICCEYGDGIFAIPLNDTDVMSIIITRPSILTVCEVQAFQTIEPATPMSTSSTMSTMPTTTLIESSTMSTPTDTTLFQTSTMSNPTNTTPIETTNSTEVQSTSSGEGQNTTTQVTNVAIGQNASQFSTLDFNGFNWTADRIVDNCTSQDDPNIHQCCGASQDISGTNLNFMRVDFDKVYSINNIVIYGRGDMEGQTKDFQVSIVDGDGSEILVYDNICCEYGDGIFAIPLNDTDDMSIIITRPSILTVCEVQAFQTIEPATPMSTSSTMSTMPTTTLIESSTMSTPTDTTLFQTSTMSNPTNTTPIETTNSTEVQSTSSGEGQNTTTQGEPNSVPGIMRPSEVVVIFILSCLFVLNNL